MLSGRRTCVGVLPNMRWASGDCMIQLWEPWLCPLCLEALCAMTTLRRETNLWLLLLAAFHPCKQTRSRQLLAVSTACLAGDCSHEGCPLYQSTPEP